MPGSVVTVALTLNPGTPDVEIKGTIDAYGAAGTYSNAMFDAAVFGPADGTFHVHNRGDIESDGTLNTDAGILLGAAGHVDNSGSILAATGVAIFGGAGGGIENAGNIDATLGLGMYLQGAGLVDNSGMVRAQEFGAVLAGGGYAVNTGVIKAATGLLLGDAAGGYVYNTGGVKALKRDGIVLAAVGSVNNTGHIDAAHDGIAMAGGGVAYNAGRITAGGDGIYLAGGIVDNYRTGRITGSPFGVYLSAAGTVHNAGLIDGEGGKTGTFGAAVGLADGGYVENAANGRLTGLSGVFAQGGALTLVNKGYIYGTGSNQATNAAGVYAGLGGTVINDGTIAGDQSDEPGVGGIVIAGTAGAVTNNGIISGFFNTAAVVLRDGGTVVNVGEIDNSGAGGVGIALQNGGAINNFGYVGAVYAGGGATVTNGGTIKGALTLAGGGMVDNDGAIGNYSGVLVTGGGTVVNAGKIGATGAGSFALYFQKGFTNQLILDSGSQIDGYVYGGGGMVELTRGSSIGTVDLDGQVSGFTNLTVDRRAEWAFGPDSSLASTLGVDDDGTIVALGTAGLTIAGALFGHGTVDSGSGPLTLDGRVGARLNVVLGAAGETLSIGDAMAFSGTIESFAAGDAIDLTGVASSLVTGVSFSAGVLSVYEGTASYQFTFSNPASFGHDTFSFFRDHGSAGITLTSKAQMAFLAPAAAAGGAAALPVPALHYAARTPTAVPSAAGASGWLDSMLQQTLGALAPVVTLQG